MPKTRTKPPRKRKPGWPRAGPGPKTHAEKGVAAKTVTLQVRVEEDVADWIKANGCSEKHREILRKAMNEALIV